MAMEQGGRRIGLLALILLAIAAVATAVLLLGPKLQSEPATAAQVEVRLASFSRAIDYAPYLVARDQGRFEAALKPLGARVTYQEFGSLADLTSAAASNRVDVIFQAEPPAMIARASGVDLRIVGLSCTLRQEILVPTNSKVRQLTDLKGATVAVLSGTSSHYGVLRNLTEAGLKPSDVRIADLAPPVARPAFQAAKVDAWAVWPPFVEQEVIAGQGRVLPGGTAQIQSVVTMAGPFVEKHRPLALAVVKVLGETKTWMGQHPEEAQAIVAKQLGVTPEVVAMAWPKHNWAAQLDGPGRADLQAKADFLFSQKLIATPVKVDGGLVAPLAP